MIKKIQWIQQVGTFYYVLNELMGIAKLTAADLPAVFGLLASFDTGRAWFDGIEEDSDEWHISYGGGFYFAPFEQIGFKFAYYTSGEEFQLSIGGSLAF